MNRRQFVLFLCSSLLVTGSGFAQKAHTPAPGTAERKAIMDAMRATAEKDLKQPVIFEVLRLRVAGPWAYARVSPTRPNGAKIDYAKTKYREQIELGAFDPQGETLLRQEGDGWKVLEWSFGSTDVPSVGWADTYRLPKSLLE